MRVILWIVAAVVSFLILIIPVGVVISAFFTLHREQGWGRNPASFPLLVVTHDNGKPTAHIVMQRDLPSLATAGDWTFIVRPDEREAILRQVRSQRDETGAKPGSFEALSVELEDRPDGLLEVHLLASRYIDTHNESWYLAHAKSVTPLARRQHLDLGVGMATAFVAPLVTAVLSAIAASMFVYARTTRRAAPETAT